MHEVTASRLGGYPGGPRGDPGPDGVAPVEVDHPIEPAHDLDFSTVGQETAELDMQTVLDEAPRCAGWLRCGWPE